MATIAEGGLFPPIIDTYLPAFNILTKVKNDGLKYIKFNLSEYNTLSEIESCHISIIRQSDYTSLFDSTKYPIGIWVKNFSGEPDLDQSVKIPYSAFNSDNFNYNEYYKVQVRLSKIEVPTKSGSSALIDGTALSAYLNNETNLAQFSEWSTVCLIRFIADNTIEIDCNGESLENNIVINSSRIALSGKYIKNNLEGNNQINSDVNYGKNDKEYLQSYEVIVSQGNTQVFSSGSQPINSRTPEAFYYTIPYFFENGIDYKIKIKYITANLYEASTSNYTVQVRYPKDSWGSQNTVAEAIAVDTVIGKVNISFEPKTQGGSIPANSQLIIRRASDEDNFTIWDTIWTKNIKTATTATISFDDFTIESGTLYKYEINYISPNSTTYFIVEGPVLSVFDYAFLTGEGTQLSVKFNDNVGSFKRNVSDNIVTTIGSKYPFITRNSNMDYRTFSLSGTIAYEMDVQNQFSSRSAIYGDWIDVYGSYFVNHYYNQRNDRVTQRKFRELVMNYLYDDIPKLFRSTSEGNILVRITDVNLTPNNQIGRMIYDFSCTATEIGEANLENYKLYKIQDFGD